LALLFYVLLTISSNTLFLYDGLGVDTTKPGRPVDINLALEQTRQALSTLKGVAYYLLQLGFVVTIVRVFLPSYQARPQKAGPWFGRKPPAVTPVSE